VKLLVADAKSISIARVNTIAVFLLVEVDVAGNAETKSDCGSTGVPIHSLPSSRLRRISFDGSD